MKLEFNDYKKRVYGCFLGKSIGGTLGMKYEGDLRYIPDITYYNPVPTEMVPNDDLDLQVVNLEILLRTGLPVCRHNIAEMWLDHLEHSCPDEYGVAKSNHQIGLRAPITGQFRNKFVAGMGGAIRSELWACLAPANPTLAATLAREDACTDHNDDGIYAEMFLAALESAAFVEKDINKLIDIGLSVVDKNCRFYSAICDTRRVYAETGDMLATREYILKNYRQVSWTYVAINVSFVVLALLSCEGDFSKAICNAVSMGYDADCTGATIGSIMGIINPDGIEDRWKKPIGDELVLSCCIINMHEWDTIGDFSNAIMSVAYEVQKYYGSDVEIEPCESLPKAKLADPWTDDYKGLYDWKIGERESLISVSPFFVNLIYPETIAVIPEKAEKFTLKLYSPKAHKGALKLFAPERWSVSPASFEIDVKAGETKYIDFFVTASPGSKRRFLANMLSMRFEVDGVGFTVNAGLPISLPWQVINEKTGEESVLEAPSIFFKVPAGAYRYKTRVQANADMLVRICSQGTRTYTLLVNGEEIRSGNKTTVYCPAFHSGITKKPEVLLHQHQIDEIELIFPDDDDEGEFFLGFSTVYGCAMWINTIGRML